jgi:hypothetical protein
VRDTISDIAVIGCDHSYLDVDGLLDDGTVRIDCQASDLRFYQTKADTY